MTGRDVRITEWGRGFSHELSATKNLAGLITMELLVEASFYTSLSLLAGMRVLTSLCHVIPGSCTAPC